MIRFISIISTAVFWLALSGCQHQPVYPDYGSVYIVSSPTPCEVMIDGKTTGRSTPVKIDGIQTGIHEYSP